MQKFIVTPGTKTKGNTSVSTALLTQSQEEADILLLLHALLIDKNVEVVIASPDTDVCLLRVQMYSRLPGDISFLTGKENLMINQSNQCMTS